MGVTFFVDPGIAADPNTRDVRTVTLSYTFFRKTGAEDASPRISRVLEDRRATSIH